MKFELQAHLKYIEDLRSDLSKSEAFEIQTIWRSNFKWSAFQGQAKALDITCGPNHLKTGQFCLDFKWFLTKWQPFVQISNGWASSFQTPFEIQTIYKPTSNLPFKIHVSLNFRSPLYQQGLRTLPVIQILLKTHLWEQSFFNFFLFLYAFTEISTFGILHHNTDDWNVISLQKIIWRFKCRTPKSSGTSESYFYVWGFWIPYHTNNTQ